MAARQWHPRPAESERRRVPYGGAPHACGDGPASRNFAFLAAGLPQGRGPELQGGGLLRSLGGWAGLTALRRGREAYLGDARVLGSSAFVEQVQRELSPRVQRLGSACPIETLCAHICAHVGITPAALRGGGRRPAISRAQAGIAYLWMERLGHPGRPLAPLLGIHPAVVYQAARRGATQPREWDRLLQSLGKTT